MAYEDISYHMDGHVARITIEREAVRNAIRPQTQQEIVDAVHRFADDGEAWVAVLTGRGDRAFSAGWDMKEQATASDAYEQYERRRLESRRQPYGHLRNLNSGDLPQETWKPIVAAVRGYCLAGGFELALNCDFIIASEDATFGLPEVTRGWPGSSHFSLPRKVGLNVAMEIILTGDPITAQRAYEIGLVNRVVPGDGLEAAADAFARRLAENPPLAVQAAKELILRGRDLPLNYPAVAWHLYDSVKRVVDQSEDRQEGLRAFIEKRKPEFHGR